jgi:hypothetical protein
MDNAIPPRNQILHRDTQPAYCFRRAGHQVRERRHILSTLLALAHLLVRKSRSPTRYQPAMAEKDDLDPKPSKTTPKSLLAVRSPASIANDALRESPLIKQWAKRPITPPGSRLVSSPCWARFSTTRPATSMGGLLASDLCKPRVMQPWYDPPAAELLPLGAAGPGQPKQMACWKPQPHPDRIHRAARRQPPESSSSSWATVSPASVFSHTIGISTSADTSASSAPSSGVRFQRQQVKRANTESLLTASFKTISPLKAAMSPGMPAAGKLGGKPWSLENLPSPFDSDSENEDENENEAVIEKGAGWNAKGGGPARKGNSAGRDSGRRC